MGWRPKLCTITCKKGTTIFHRKRNFPAHERNERADQNAEPPTEICDERTFSDKPSQSSFDPWRRSACQRTRADTRLQEQVPLRISRFLRGRFGTCRRTHGESRNHRHI